MNFRFKTFVVLLLTVTLLAPTTISGDTFQIRTPDIIEHEQFIGYNDQVEMSIINDDPFGAPVPVQVTPIRDGVSLFETTNTPLPNRFAYGVIGENDEFTTPASNGSLLHFNPVNQEPDTQVMVTRQYVNILQEGDENLDGTNIRENILLREDIPAGFMINVPQDEVFQPLALSLDVFSPGGSENVRVSIVSPDATTTSGVFNIPEFREELIPIVPPQAGEYSIFIEPTNDDVIFEHVAILNDFSVTREGEGVIEQVEGERSILKFFEVPQDFFEDPFRPSWVEIDGFTHTDPVYSDRILPGVLGTSEIRIHSQSDIFGTPFPTMQLHVNDTIIISMLIQPPDDENDSVRSAKNELGIPDGFQIETGFWLKEETLDDLPLNQDILIGDNNDDTFFNFEPGNDVLIGMNDTESILPGGPIESQARFWNLEDMSVTTINAVNHDLLNADNPSLTILPAGHYLVEINNFEDDNAAQINTFSYSLLNSGASQTVNNGLGVNEFFMLPPTANRIAFDSFNLTYYENNSQSVTWNLDIYDYSGSRLCGIEDTFDQFVGGVDGNNTYLTCSDNIRGGWLRIRQVGNTVYNQSLNDPNSTPLAIDSPTIQPELEISRVEHTNYLMDINPLNEYFTNINQAMSGLDLNFSKTNIEGRYSFMSESGMNRIFLQSTNMSMQVLLKLDGANTWFNIASTLEVIDAVNHYTVELQFATPSPTLFGLIVQFGETANGNTNNGTFSLLTESADPTSLEPISLDNMIFTSVSSNTIIDTDLYVTNLGTDNDLITGIAITVIFVTALSGGVLYLRRRT